MAVRNQLAADAIDRANVLPDARIIWTEPLEVVVEMGQVGEEERRRMPLVHLDRRLRDPLARFDVRLRAPETKKWKRSQLSDKPCAQVDRLAVDIQNLPAVRRIDWPRRHRPVRRAVHVEPPEHVRDGHRRIDLSRAVPHTLARHQRVRLLPEHHLRQIAKVPAVADDAVVARHQAREIGRLRTARHSRRDRANGRHRAVARERVEVWCVLAEECRRQPDDVEEKCRVHAS